MVRITLSHINKYGPLQFPAKKVQLFVEATELPRTNLSGFYRSIVDKWLLDHPDRQQFGDYEKDIVDKSAMPNGSKVYTATDEALGKVKPAVTEEEI